MGKIQKIPIIDLFAGPGGLGEGFSALKNDFRFQIALSIEMDIYAHQTLLFRAFFRQFDNKNCKPIYDYIKSNNPDLAGRRELFKKYKSEYNKACNEAKCLELGKDNAEIYAHLEKNIARHLKEDLPWVLIGGPPCQAYSLAGRSRNAANVNYSLKEDARSSLYKEYLNIIAKYQPAIFVMENVKGMLSAKIDGQSVVEQIMSDLRSPAKAVDIQLKRGKKHNYKLFSLVRHGDESELKPSDFLIKSEEYGIPQRRHRVIILGVRDDYVPEDGISILEKQPAVALKKAIAKLPALFPGFSSRKTGLTEFDQKLLEEYDHWMTLVGSYFSSNMSEENKLAEILFKSINALGTGRKGPKPEMPEIFKAWVEDEKLADSVLNHEARNHMRSDLLRYFYMSCFAKAYGYAPKLCDLPEDLLPAHKNAKSGKFNDRFRVQLADTPSTTITSHISKDGHYYIHPDPQQCRSLTVREAARLQTFPDNYFFCGNRTQQYHQVGNAVPPLLANKIAAIVYEILEKSGRI